METEVFVVGFDFEGTLNVGDEVQICGVTDGGYCLFEKAKDSLVGTVTEIDMSYRLPGTHRKINVELINN